MPHHLLILTKDCYCFLSKIFEVYNIKELIIDFHYVNFGTHVVDLNGNDIISFVLIRLFQIFRGIFN
jgi:hypothetical protein